MKTIPRDKSDLFFQKFWEKCLKECIKIEVLQDYTGEDDGRSLKAWLRGDKKASIEFMLQDKSIEWIEMCQAKIKSGVVLKRYRIVEESYTPYLSWELEHYKHINIPFCGEEVYLVRRVELTKVNIPAGDLMIFDKKLVIENSYDATGLMTHQTFYDESDEISRFLKIIPALKGKTMF